MHSHVGFLDESTRRTWYNPELILDDIGLKPGMIFADVGCGNGFFSLLSARTVGSLGKVYAVDSNPAAIEKLRYNASKQGLENINAVLGRGEETIFCRKCVDIVFYSMVLHDFYDPEKVLLNARKMLKPRGILVDLDWKKEQMSFGPPEPIRFSEEKASGLIETAGFVIEQVKDAGLYHYIITARVKPQ